MLTKPLCNISISSLVDDVRTKISNLRTVYNRNKQQPSGSGAKKKHWLHEKFSFLDKFSLKRPSVSTLDSQQDVSFTQITHTIL